MQALQRLDPSVCGFTPLFGTVGKEEASVLLGLKLVLCHHHRKNKYQSFQSHLQQDGDHAVGHKIIALVTHIHHQSGCDYGLVMARSRQQLGMKRDFKDPGLAVDIDIGTCMAQLNELIKEAASARPKMAGCHLAGTKAMPWFQVSMAFATSVFRGVARLLLVGQRARRLSVCQRPAAPALSDRATSPDAAQ